MRPERRGGVVESLQPFDTGPAGSDTRFGASLAELFFARQADWALEKRREIQGGGGVGRVQESGTTDRQAGKR